MNRETATETTCQTNQPPPHGTLTVWTWDEYPDYAEWRCSCSEPGMVNWSPSIKHRSVHSLVVARHREHVATIT